MVARVRVERLEMRDLRNIRMAEIDLGPALNVFVGRNAQGKTSVLEGVGLLARGRSFRTRSLQSVIRRGCAKGWVSGRAHREVNAEDLEVQLTENARRLCAGGKELRPAAYGGKLDVQVYATERLKILLGGMRERRDYVDRQAASLWPAFAAQRSEHERLLRQRNQALADRRRDLDAWDERFARVGARVRLRRQRYVTALNEALAAGYRPAGESYALRLKPNVGGQDEAAAVADLMREIESRRRDELRAGISLVGAHRDEVRIDIEGNDVAESASSGQARSLLLAMTLAALAVSVRERGETPVALLDDLDSELDPERSYELCRLVARRGQALVTTAHPAWAESLRGLGPTFHVSDGHVSGSIERTA